MDQTATSCRENCDKLMDDEFGKGEDVGHEENQEANETGQRDAVKEDITKDLALVAVPFGGGARDDDALGVDHFSHDAPATVGCGHQNGRNANLGSGYFLEAAEEHVGRSV